MTEKVKGVWIEQRGWVTAGGDPVWACPKCGATHVYGVEHQHRQTICENCGQRNVYPWEAKGGTP